jgi:hypothetical protein
VAKLIGKIFKKNEDVKKNKSKISFEYYIEKEFGREFLVQKLNLSENEFDLFIRFCKEDNHVTTVINKGNKLDTFDFLIKKRNEFKPQ